MRPIAPTPAEAFEERQAEELVIPVVEETARIDKRKVSAGKVRVTMSVETTDRLAAEALAKETVEVERIAIGRAVTEPPPVRTEGDVTIVPVIEERLVVTKELVLIEEIHIRRRRVVDRVELPVTLRRQRAEIERLTDD